MQCALGPNNIIAVAGSAVIRYPALQSVFYFVCMCMVWTMADPEAGEIAAARPLLIELPIQITSVSLQIQVRGRL